MWEVINYFKEKSLKKNWNPKYDELFSILTVDNVDKSIVPFIELLKTSDYHKALATYKASKKNIFDPNENMINDFKKFVSYLLEDNRYIDLFQQAMQRYRIIWENTEVYDNVYNATLDLLTKTLNNINNKNFNDFSPFYVSQVIKLLRGEVFVFNLGKWVVRFEKDYLYWSDAEKINEDHSSKPVYGLRAHVWEWASIYSIWKIFEELWEFLRNVDVWVAPYVGMTSWLLDLDFLRYRCKQKWWSDDKIDNFINMYYSTLWDIDLKPINDSKQKDRIYKRIKNHLKDSDKNLIKEYIKSWEKLKEWRSLKKIDV